MAATIPSEPRQRPRLGVHSEHAHYKWWALSCTSFGMLLATVNSGTLIIALPELERALHSSLLQLVWVIIAYIIASTVLVMPAGRLSDMFGRKRAYVTGFVVFSLASLGAGFASSGGELIGWRVLQGVGGALIFANAAAIVTDAFPADELGLAMGTNTMVAAVGLVIGPVLGGALVTIGWSWVFWFNVPLGALGCVWAALVLRDVVRRDAERGLDVAGTVCCIVGLTSLTFALSKGGLTGWDDSLVIGGLVIARDLPAAVGRDRDQDARSDARPHDLQEPPVRSGGGGRVHQRARALRADVPLRLLLPGAPGPGPDHGGPRAGADGGRHGRRLADRRSHRGSPRLAHAGRARDADLGRGAGRDDHARSSTPYWQSAIWLALVGIGSGVFMSPNTAAMMAAVPAKRRGVASGARTMLQNMGAVLSISFVMAVITSAVPKNVLFSIFSGVTSGLDARQLAPFIDNMHTALWTLAVVSLIGGVVSLMRPAHVREAAS